MENKEIAIKEQINQLREERRYLANLRTIIDKKYDSLTCSRKGTDEELKELDIQDEKYLNQIHEIDKKIYELEKQLKQNNIKR